MTGFWNVPAATVLESLLGLVGVFSLHVDEKTVEKVVNFMVAFAAGAMLAGALAHPIPEALNSTEWAPEIAILGFSGFFVLERYLHWHHCHRGKGGIVGWFTTPDWLKAPLLAFAAGGFMYISASDLVPEFHREKDLKKSTRHFLAFVLGVVLMTGIKKLVHH